MTDLATERARGDRATQLLENELLQEAFATIRDNLTAQWAASAYKEAEGREECYRMLHALNEVERHLHSVVETGRMAAAQIDDEERVKQRLARIHPYHGKA